MQAQAVGGIDELLELFGRAEAGRDGEEVGDLVAEGGVVGVLHHGHQLNGRVARLLDVGQQVLSELCNNYNGK